MRTVLIRRTLAFVPMATACGFLFGPGTLRIWADDDSQKEALRSLMSDALSAAKNGDQSKLEEIARGLRIPNYETWFKATFGEEAGSKLAGAYMAHVDQDENAFPKLIQGMARQEGQLIVEDPEGAKVPGISYCGNTLLRSVKNDASFYTATLEEIGNSPLHSFHRLGYFTFVDGAYRWLNCQSLGLIPDVNPPVYGAASGPIRVGGNVEAARLIKQVQPVYPEMARAAKLSGTVRLHAIIATDGTVASLQVISGHPLLVQSAIDAVRQWTYQPTVFNGQPTEVDTTIDVIFALNPRPAQQP